MSRLAAYYQEDFQYHPVNQVPKQRKSAYVFYEEPERNLLNNYVLNTDRIRSLATSEPSLSPISQTYSPKKMTLKHKPIVYGNQLIENSHPSMQFIDNDHNLHCSSNRFSGDAYDNEHVYRNDGTCYNDKYLSKHEHVPKDKSHKRFSYAEPCNSNLSGDIHQHPNYNKYHPVRQIETTFNVYDNRYQHSSRDYYYEPSQSSLSPRSPVYSHSTPNHSRWQHWPHTHDDSLLNRSLLSPPSPHDSGLSSQSIGSSPSLEADFFPSRPESVIVGRSGRESVCLCRNGLSYDSKSHQPNLCRHDSGRSSGVYSAYSHPRESLRFKNGINRGALMRDDFNYNEPQTNIRYGKLGLIGEPVQNGSSHCSKQNCEKSSSRRKNRHLESMYESSFENIAEMSRRTNSRMSNYNHQPTQYEKPFVVVTEASDKSTESEDPMSPDIEISEKSDDMESSSSVTASTSKSSSVSSSDSEINCNRKKTKTTEKEIRELEDMYHKCNLSDVDLLDRAERRDLPTVHQMRKDSTSTKLKRSKSDTLYETVASFRNPYEIPRRAPPLRRSGMPDRIADDMALRKLHKATTRSSTNGVKNTITYMLCNSHFTPTVPGFKDILLVGYPDVEYDDLSYRKHYLGKKSKIADPQPPFGIPLRPPPTQKVFNDYIHAVPSDCPQPLCHPRGNPDVVRDDLAFRALRKEEPERMYYDISQLYKIRKC